MSNRNFNLTHFSEQSLFHTLGFHHPPNIGGPQGIMKYPPEKPTQTDIDQVANDGFLKFDFIISPKKFNFFK